MNNIESQLKNLPRFNANELFKDKLKQRLLREVRRTAWISWLPRMATVMAAFLIVVVGTAYYRSSQSPSQEKQRTALELFRVAPASAAELIERHIEKFLAQGTIYHEKTRFFLDESDPITYEVWEDTESDRFNNKVKYPDGREVWQGFNLDFRWDVDYAAKVVRKDIYIWQSAEEKNTTHGTRVRLADKFQQLIQQGVLSLAEQELNGNQVYVVVDKRDDSPDKYWDKLYFDKDTFQLLQTEKTNPDGTFARLVYEIQEAIPRTEENLASVFRFTSPGPIFIVLERRFDTQTGYHDDYPATFDTSSPSPEVTATPRASLAPEPSPSPTPQS